MSNGLKKFRYTSPGGEDVDYIVGAYFQTADVDVTDYVPLGSFLALAGPPVSMLVGTNWDRFMHNHLKCFQFLVKLILILKVIGD
jgi:hypothetical protein